MVRDTAEALTTLLLVYPLLMVNPLNELTAVAVEVVLSTPIAPKLLALALLG
jgi:hypothetical protein